MRWPLNLLLLTLTVRIAAAEPALTIHEWGTFTNLQDEAGLSVAGINSDDEPLPAFTHNLAWQWSVGDAGTQKSNRMKQGYPQCHPDVTIRLETPVVYFHPAVGVAAPEIDFGVKFRGGMLTQHYPQAVTGTLDHTITADSVGKLDWHRLRLGLDRKLPDTTDHVWTAPRKVDAASVTNLDDETEKFLFYRGVGHVDAPLQLARVGTRIEIRGHLDSTFVAATRLPISRLWFCEFREGGRCAFREIKPIIVSSDNRTVQAETPAEFAADDFSPDRLGELRKDMRAALVSDGLFGDEADALLSTWELSYFKSQGVRLFYLVPREWTEHYLPLKLTPPVPVTRVMVGRIDLVTPEHRRELRQIADDADPNAHEAALWNVYDHLGRFRNALVLDEQRRRPSKSLDEFVRSHDLEAAR